MENRYWILSRGIPSDKSSESPSDCIPENIFLTVEKDEIVASNTRIGRFDRLKLSAKERIQDYKVANAVAVVVTNQRYVAYGVLRGGWQSVRLLASEQTKSIEVGDYSANVVTSDRILIFNGRKGAWNETRRPVD